MNGDRLTPSDGVTGTAGDRANGMPHMGKHLGAVDPYAYALAEEVMRQVRRGLIAYRGKRAAKDGRVHYTFTTVPGLTNEPTAIDCLVDWMRKTRKLGRREAQMECDPPCKSHRQHEQAIRKLVAAGEIVKEGKYWIWKEQE